ncbi:acylphosphatase [Halocola ammonii]
MEAREIWISGVVQGVFFRKSTQEKAQSLDLKGWVKNLDDGRVQAWAEGESEKLRQLEKWLHKGPDRAEVDLVKIETREPRDYSDFEIQR